MQSESFSVTCATLVCSAININDCCHPFPHTPVLYNPFCIYPHERNQAKRHQWQPSAESPESLACSPSLMLASKCILEVSIITPKLLMKEGQRTQLLI